MAVSNTYTLERSYGSRHRGQGGRLPAQQRDDRLQLAPGRDQPRRRIGTPANQIAPGKRMLSSQTPTIVAKDGKVVLVTGSPGSRTIINTVAAACVVNVLDFDMDIAPAVDAPRLHHQWFPDRVRFEGTTGIRRASGNPEENGAHGQRHAPGRCPFHLGSSPNRGLHRGRGPAHPWQGGRFLTKRHSDFQPFDVEQFIESPADNNGRIGQGLMGKPFGSARNDEG